MAPPPPATPTPHRFLVPKRSQPRQETPKAFQAGGQQFQATPRFSLHSTPRASGSVSIGAPALLSSSARTPALATAGAGVEVGFGPGAFFRPTPKNTDPINDVISSSPPFAEQRPGGGDGGGKRRDFIDFDVDVSVEEDADADANEDEEAVPESSPIRGSSRRGASSEPEEHDTRSRSPKRRRISISSDFGIESSQHEHEGVLLEHDPRDEDIDMIESSLPLPLLHPLSLSLPNRQVPPTSDDAEAEAEAEAETTVVFSPPYSPSSPSLLTPKPAAAAAQPTFQKPPRFKPAAGTEALDGSHQHHDYSHEPPPDVFSPHRRRDAKYVRGGLAAEVRDWFVDVWAGTGTVAARREGWAARLRVDEARGAPGAVLVTGRHVRDDNVDGSGNGDGDWGSRGSVRVVLAGSPRLTGLAKGEEVRQGSVVGIGKPTWEVSIQDQGRWSVVCEWAVLS